MKAESRQIPQKLAARLKFVYCIHSNDNYLLTVRFISLSTILVRMDYLAKINNLPNHHGAGLPEARGPMQSQRLHRLKASPDYAKKTHSKIF